MENGKTIEGEAPTQDSLDWLARGRELNKESLKILSDESQKMVTLGSTLLAAYTGAITLLKIVDKNPSVSDVYIYLAIPIVFWIATIFWAFKANFPKVYTFDPDSPTAIRATINNMINDKHKELSNCLYAFVISLFVSALGILGSLYTMMPAK